MAERDQAKRNLDLQQHLSTGEKNPRGIPHVVFIVSQSVTESSIDVHALVGFNHSKPNARQPQRQDDVEAFLQRLGGVAAETAIGAFNELYS